MLTVNLLLFISLVRRGWWDIDRMVIDYFKREK